MKKLLIICMCIMLVFTSTSCGNEKKNNKCEIYIPILADNAWLTADGSFINGVHLAVTDLNNQYSSKGFTIKTAVIDDKAQYEKGVEMANKLAGDSTVTAVLNLQNFDVSKTTAGILTDSKKLTIFPYGAYDSLFTLDNQYLFCGVPASSDLGKTMAEYAVKSGYKQIAVYHNGKQSQEEIATAFELALLNTGSKVVDYIPSIASDSDFDKIYSRWQSLDVDCVIITQYGIDQAFNVLKTIRNEDKNIPIIGEPVFNRANALAANKTISEGMVVPSTLVIEDNERLKEFKEQYKSIYEKDADIWAVQGYDMIRLIVDNAVKLNTNDSKKIAASLHNKNVFQGIGRHIAFSKGGALIIDKKLPVLICRTGCFVEK